MRVLKRIMASTGAIAALCAASSAFAVMSAPYGWYLEGNVGRSYLSNRSYSGTTSAPGLAGNANLGYKFMPYMGAELGYTIYAPTIIRTSTGTKAGTNRFYSYDLAIRGILPFGDWGVEAFGKIGAGRLSSDLTSQNNAASASLGIRNKTSNATGVFYGLGLQYYFMPEMSVNTQWQQVIGNNTTGSQGLLSVGLSFIFD